MDNISAEQQREMTKRLLTELHHSQALNATLTHENALLKRMKFAAQIEKFSERFNAEQRSLLEDEIAQLQPPAAKQQPKRQPLPAHRPRREISHEPESTKCARGCAMKRIGEELWCAAATAGRCAQGRDARMCCRPTKL